MTDRSDPEAGILYLIHVLTHASRVKLDALLIDLQLTSFQYTILSVLGRHDGLSSSGLSRRFHVSPQAMSELVLGLERNHLVKRRADPTDRKIMRLSLTADGRKLVAIGDKFRILLEQTLFAGRSERDIQRVREVVSGALAILRRAAD